jgi:hypothetical protein
MVAFLAAAWQGLAKPGRWDLSPLVWAALLLLAVRVVDGRLRWWVVPLAIAAGLPCATLAAHFGPLTGVAVVIAVSLVLAPVVRARRGP